MRHTQVTYSLLMGWIGLCLLSGCASMMETKSKGAGKGKEDSKWSLFKKKEYQIPQTMNVTWVHDIISVPGKPPTRGFGGRIYFYNEKSQAIPVDGELMVYGFDDTDRGQAGRALETLGMDQADKRFRFTEEQFTTHFSQSDLGASYSIWVPWDAAPGPKRKIMLIPTFKSKDGKVMRGNAATLLLPGWSPEDLDGGVIHASATMKSNGSPNVVGAVSTGLSQPGTFGSPEVEDPNARPRTTTIQMPARAAAKAQPLLTPEQANDIIERARNGEFSKVNSAPNQQFLDQLAALNQASLQMNATANALNASAMNNAAVKPASLDANLSMIQQQPVNQPTANQFPSSQSSSNRGAAPSGLPPFHVPTTGMSSSLLPGMPSGVSTSSNFGLQVPSQSQNQSHSQ